MDEPGTYQRPPHGWTCFHCGETFTTVGSARDHFGATPDAEPGCMVRVKLGGERGLLAALRKAEKAAYDVQNALMFENAEAHIAMRAMQHRYDDGLWQAEAAGYERGLIDGAAIAGVEVPGVATVWHEGSKSFHRAVLLRKMEADEVNREAAAAVGEQPPLAHHPV